MAYRTVSVTPSAARLVSSLRDIGYDFPAAVADLVDNSLEAGATMIEVRVGVVGEAPQVAVIDNGHGMTWGALNEALRFGTRRRYEPGALGKFGLGLKTASLSQCRRISVVSRASSQTSARRLDLDHVLMSDRWEVLALGRREVDSLLGSSALLNGSGTVVIWDELDRVLGNRPPSRPRAKRRLERLAAETSLHLGTVFHRFIEGRTGSGRRSRIVVNGKKVQPWNPLAPTEEHTEFLDEVEFNVTAGSSAGWVRFTPAILPSRERFSTAEAFELAGGDKRWNRQQGFYVYRSDRMIQSGGWCGMRTMDEHSKLARIALDFDSGLDEAFRVNVAKMRVRLPAELRSQLDELVGAVCRRAEMVYRHRRNGRAVDRTGIHASAGVPAAVIGVALEESAEELGLEGELSKIVDLVRERTPEVADSLGL